MARARRIYRLYFLAYGSNAHYLTPVFPDAIPDEQAYRAADGKAVAYSGDNLGFILLDFHAGAASIAGLPPLKVLSYVVFTNWQAGDHPLNDRYQSLAVCLPSG